jgi:hypothetical protein
VDKTRKISGTKGLWWQTSAGRVAPLMPPNLPRDMLTLVKGQSPAGWATLTG